MATPDAEMHGSDILDARSVVPSAYRNAPDAEEARTWVWVLWTLLQYLRLLQTAREPSAVAGSSSDLNATASVTTLLRPRSV